MNAFRRLLPGGLLLVLLSAAGCGPKIHFVPVSGKVTLDGKPVPNVVVRFQPDVAKGTTGPISEGYTDEEGRFVLRCASPAKDGAVVGWHRVVIEDPNEERPMQGQPKKKQPRIPLEYGVPATNGSRHPSVEVKEGSPTVDLALKWR